MKIKFNVGDLLHVNHHLYYITARAHDEVTMILLDSGIKQTWTMNAVQWWFDSDNISTIHYPVIKQSGNK
jgi:hypothetical protein